MQAIKDSFLKSRDGGGTGNSTSILSPMMNRKHRLTFWKEKKRHTPGSPFPAETQMLSEQAPTTGGPSTLAPTAVKDTSLHNSLDFISRLSAQDSAAPATVDGTAAGHIAGPEAHQTNTMSAGLETSMLGVSRTSKTAATEQSLTAAPTPVPAMVVRKSSTLYAAICCGRV